MILGNFSSSYKKTNYKVVINDLGTDLTTSDISLKTIEKGLPPEYQQVEFIQGMGAQWINTKYPISTTVRMEARLEDIGAGTAASNQCCIWGCDRLWRSSFNYVTTDNHLRYHTDTNSNYNYIANATMFMTGILDCKWNCELGEINDLVTKYQGQDTGWPPTNNSPIYLWRGNGGNGTSQYKCYYWKIWDKEELVRDYIPCYRKIDNVVGLYDLVSREFFTNKGTGYFQIGRPIDAIPKVYEELEYIESNGTQYIDTGVRITPNFSCHIKFNMTDEPNPGDNDILASASDSDNWLLISCLNGAFRFLPNIATAVATPMYRLSQTHNAYCSYNGTTFTSWVHSTTYSSATTGSSVNNLYLFARNSTLGKSNSKLYFCQIYDGATMVHNYVPCRHRYTHVVGLYDLVEDEFVGNDGTGTFRAGAFLPEEYQQLEYIETTGTQYIDTQVQPKANTFVELEVMPTNYTLDNKFFGAHDYTNKLGLAIGIISSKWRFGSYWSNNTIQAINNRTTILAKGTTWYANNNTGSVTEGITAYTENMRLGGTHTTEAGVVTYYYGKARFYRCKIYESNVMVRDLIPCYNKSTNVVGMYDLVSNQMFTNSGTGAFIKGEEVHQRIPTFYPIETIPTLISNLEEHKFLVENWTKGSYNLYVRDAIYPITFETIPEYEFDFEEEHDDLDTILLVHGNSFNDVSYYKGSSVNYPVGTYSVNNVDVDCPIQECGVLGLQTGGVRYNNTIAFPTYSKEFTLEFFRRKLANVSSEDLLSYGTYGDTTQHALHLDTNDNQYAYMWSDNAQVSSNASAPFVTDRWYHVAYVLKDGYMNVYLNGIWKYRQTWGNVRTEYGIAFGGNVPTTQSGTYINSYLTEIRISKVARYTENFKPRFEQFSDKVPDTLILRRQGDEL